MNIVAIGAHPDDIELGCFGTLARYASEGSGIAMLVLTRGEGGGSMDKRMAESRESARLIGAELHFGDLVDTQINDGVETIRLIETCIEQYKPEVVFGPSTKDTHQDHRNAGHAFISATRTTSREVYAYQGPSTTHHFVPSAYFDVTDHFEKKLDAVRIHRSQGNKSYMADRAVKALGRYRAYELGVNDRLVEAFEPLRIWNPYKS